MKVRELRLCTFMADHYGERMTAREIYNRLDDRYGSQLGFSSPMALVKLLAKHSKEVDKSGSGVNEYIL